MTESVEAHKLLGAATRKHLILLAGPNQAAMETMAHRAGIETHTDHRVDQVEPLRNRVRASARSLAVIRCIPEVEGVLDRAAFGPYHELAYGADRVVYVGPHGAALVWPQPEGARTFLRVHQGRLQVQQSADTVRGRVVGLTVDRL